MSDLEGVIDDGAHHKKKTTRQAARDQWGLERGGEDIGGYRGKDTPE